ncbi:MAG: c-type cytochrome [Coriobacteriia bacterium]|nr:c-type cytochrome [Coriobacteriia bacterium]
MKMSFKVVLWGGLAVFFAVVTVVVFTPVAVWKPATTEIAHPYTPSQELGRTLFLSNGCNYCHTQYVRDVDNAMGPVSDPGDYNYDDPMILGSERTGPDLSYIGRKRSQQWEIDHAKDPRQYSPMSIMPSFAFLSDSDLRAISDYLFYLGNRNAAEFMIESPDYYKSATSPGMPQAMPSFDASAPPQGWPTFEQSGLYEGKQIYVSHCMTCHGCAGNGLGTYGGTLIVTPANFKVEPINAMPDNQWFWHVSEGIQGSVMPPWKESLTESQRWNVIHYIQQVYAAPIERDPNEGDPPPKYQGNDPLPVTVANIDGGKEIWTRECAVCHGDEGKGQGIYRAGIEPVPPNFDNPDNYNTYEDADYFWRISEGVPWTAMPTWKLIYTPTQRWQLVQYIRTMFTQTIKQPPQLATEAQKYAGNDPAVLAVQLKLTVPSSATFDAGRQQFLIQCAHCHGLAGDGTGWDGDYLNPKPANLQQKLAPSAGGITDGTTYAKVTNGMKNTVMPIWNEFLSTRMRWNDVAFLKDAFTTGLPPAGNQSHYGKGDVPIQYVRVDDGIFQSEIATVVPSDGKPLYEQYCQTCHGAQGKGDGPGAKNLIGGPPAPLPKDMNQRYIFSAIRGGIPHTMMYGFQPLLTETQIWDLTAYTVNLTGGRYGG